MNILLVEDDRDMLNILEVYFDGEGFNVFLADMVIEHWSCSIVKK